MLDKYSIYFKYRCDGAKKAVVSTEAENDDYIISEDISDADRIVLSLTPKDGKSIRVEEFSLKYYYDYLPRFKQFRHIFANGYQSWTDTKEYFPDEHTPLFKSKAKNFMKMLGLVEGLGLEHSGDYKFAKYSKKPGNFHSFSYTYFRNNEDIELFGSLNESTGYTIFYIDVVNKSLVLTKELEGKTITDTYEVMNVARYEADYNTAFDKWFADMNIPAPRMKHANGYTSWYNYYTKISEDIILRDLESLAATGEKIDIFQIDDGYQTNVGDWMSLKKEFPNGMKYIADAIHDKGMLAGLWLAPFGANTKSQIFKEHKNDWFVRDSKGKLVKAGLNWGGFYTLDFYNEEVREHIRSIFNTVLNEWGYDMVKLDFLYEVAAIPYNDKTRGEIMTDAMNFLRECCGDKLILGCGVPLYPAFGKVDFCRIGADVALSWKDPLCGMAHHRERVSTVNTLNNTIFRRHLDGRAFVNDPDVFLLRDNNMKLKPYQRKLIATVNKLFANILFTSDNVDAYKDWQRELLKDTFKESDISITSAEYVTTDIIVIKCVVDGKPYSFTLNMKEGTMLERDIRSTELAGSSFDKEISTKSDVGFTATIAPEFDNLDDFEFTRPLTEEEKQEIEQKRIEEEEYREKRRMEERQRRLEEARKAAESTAAASDKADNVNNDNEAAIADTTEADSSEVIVTSEDTDTDFAPLSDKEAAKAKKRLEKLRKKLDKRIAKVSKKEEKRLKKIKDKSKKNPDEVLDDSPLDTPATPEEDK